MRVGQASLLEHIYRCAARIPTLVMACVPTSMSQALSECLCTSCHCSQLQTCRACPARSEARVSALSLQELMYPAA